MKLTNAERAAVLSRALPYIQRYNNKIVVVKYGGNAMSSEELKKDVMSDLVLLSLVGIKVVLIHGGGPEITDMLTKIGKKSEFVDGLRVTDKESAQIVTMVLAGKVNKELVGLIQSIGGKSVGISGMDGHLLLAEKLNEKLGFVGSIKKINPEIILDMLSMGYIPVISTVGCDNEGNTYNINADTAASEIASEIGAESLILMTDVTGILQNKDDPATLIPYIDIKEAENLISSGVISEGMLPKVRCCIDAAANGVKRVFIIDGRVAHSILIELFTDEGIGTMFSK